MEAQLQKDLSRFADTDMRSARKEGVIGIAQTKFGLLNLYYHKDARTYELIQCGANPKVLATGAKSIVKQAIVNAYDVVTA